MYVAFSPAKLVTKTEQTNQKKQTEQNKKQLILPKERRNI